MVLPVLILEVKLQILWSKTKIPWVIFISRKNVTFK